MVEPVLHGPRDGEGPTRWYGPVGVVAVLSDVHGNVPALAAVLAEPDVGSADLVVICGDLTWGPEPQQTYELIAALGARALCVRGNADRYAAEIGAGIRDAGRPREAWIPARHSAEAMAFLQALPFSVVVQVGSLGPVLFCHGSPRSDHELVTPGTSDERFAALTAGVRARTLVTGHTHLQFDRTVAGRRSVGPGSVGLPFHRGVPGTAYWALLGPDDVRLRSSRYDADEAVARTRASGDPSAETIVTLLTSPPTPEEIVTDAESRVFSD
ncbi:metallophosphoesterase family protein [Streptacidiphilus sp. PAMC 29251]